jgi:hypothetical protein
MVFLSSPRQKALSPAAVPAPPQVSGSEAAAKQVSRGEHSGDALTPPTYHRLTDKELQRQMPPGSSLAE